ncbi:MAG: alpha-glucosidase [Methylobacteriaceae bacterium]|jgi:alpha-glucosidase|nr:alpha-glucosidase [Methylobacteriaceae bacterium]
MKQQWWKEAVAYEIYPRSFMDSNGDGIGDLAGILSKLDYLKELGVSLLWICPIFPSPNDDNGYDISDYQGIQPEFGTMDEFDALLAAVHARGMRLMLDLVLNHTSDEHPWFIDSRSSRTSAKRDWYIWRDGRNGGPPNNWESIFKGPAWEFDEVTGQYYLHIFSRKQPDLNWTNPAVTEAFSHIIRWWLDKGVDGFRLDAVSHMKKDPLFADARRLKGAPPPFSMKKYMNVPGILDIVDRLFQRSFNLYADAVTVGEANGVKAARALEWVGEEQRRMSMLFSFEHLDLWEDEAGTRLDVPALKKALFSWQKALNGKGWNALFIENHDIARVVSSWGDDTRYRAESATTLATLYFLLQGTPFIYQGQELGMTNFPFRSIDEFNDIRDRNTFLHHIQQGMSPAAALKTVARVARDNSRTPMQWDASKNAGFTSGTPWLKVNPNHTTINVDEESRDPKSVLNYYKQLIALRKRFPTLVYGATTPVLPDHPRLVAYTRHDAKSRILVLCNASNRPSRYHNPETPLLLHDALLLANRPVPRHATLTGVILQPWEARVYRLK